MNDIAVTPRVIWSTFLGDQVHAVLMHKFKSHIQINNLEPYT